MKNARVEIRIESALKAAFTRMAASNGRTLSEEIVVAMGDRYLSTVEGGDEDVRRYLLAVREMVRAQEALKGKGGVDE